ncbi:hypothetical protein WJX74_003855 [Apatococcus lobatus]|uniref:Uncharacterized protein n=1 Tax=Apatococcus lobatus TaxID=904363 RepID=A0AAW1S226_9CHLO
MGAQPTSPGKSRDTGSRLQETLMTALTELIVRQPADPLCWLYTYFQGLLPGASAAERAVCQFDQSVSTVWHRKEAAAAAFLAGIDDDEGGSFINPLQTQQAGSIACLAFSELQGPEVTGRCSLEEFTAVISAAVLVRQTSEAVGALTESHCKASDGDRTPFPKKDIFQGLQDALRSPATSLCNTAAHPAKLDGSVPETLGGAEETELEMDVFDMILQAV